MSESCGIFDIGHMGIIEIKLTSNRFMMGVNAGNSEKDILWLEAVNSKKYIIDKFRPHKEF